MFGFLLFVNGLSGDGVSGDGFSFLFLGSFLVSLSGYDNDKFASWLCLFKVGADLGEGAAYALFVDFGNLAAGGAMSLRTKYFSELCEGLDDAVRTLVEDHRALFVAEALESGGASLLLRQETFETEAVAGQSARHEGGDEGRRSGQALHLDAACHGSTDEHKTRVADGGSAGIADECHGFAGGKTGGEGFGRFVLVELMVAHEACLDVVVLEEDAAGACIFSEYDVRFLEDAECAEGNVLHVADGSGNEVEQFVES